MNLPANSTPTHAIAMADYTIAATTIPHRTQLEEDALPVRNHACRSQFLLHPEPTEKVCLFFHGFTAGPFQFLPLGQLLFNAGYNVLIPRLPGHGQAGDWGRDNPPPLPNDTETYQLFALHWLEEAKKLGSKVIVGGLSAGGAMASWLAIERPTEIDRAVVFAAYLSSCNKVVDLFVNTFNTYLEWLTDDPAKAAIGYEGFELENLRVFLDLGKDVLERSQTVATPPMFIVSTESDLAVSNPDHRTLWEQLLPRQPQTWYYCFDKDLNIPHTMMTKAEGNAWENLLNVMTKAFLESNLSWSEIEEIAYHMTEGKTCDQAIADLGLTKKASPDLPALMTMIDKRAIVLKRNPSWSEDA